MQKFVNRFYGKSKNVKVRECQRKISKNGKNLLTKNHFYALLSTAFFTLHIITYKFFHITYCYLQKFTLHIAIYKFFHITYYHLQIFSHYILSSTKNFYITYCNLQIFTLHIAIYKNFSHYILSPTIFYITYCHLQKFFTLHIITYKFSFTYLIFHPPNTPT